MLGRMDLRVRSLAGVVPGVDPHRRPVLALHFHETITIHAQRLSGLQGNRKRGDLLLLENAQENAGREVLRPLRLGDRSLQAVGKRGHPQEAQSQEETARHALHVFLLRGVNAASPRTITPRAKLKRPPPR